MVYGGTPPTELVHAKLPDVAIGSKKSLQSCLLGYLRARLGRAMCPTRAAPA